MLELHADSGSTRVCGNCGAPVNSVQFSRRFRRQLTPEDAEAYWRGFFKPFFIVAFAFLGIFFIWAMVLLVIWHFMFRH